MNPSTGLYIIQKDEHRAREEGGADVLLALQTLDGGGDPETRGRDRQHREHDEERPPVGELLDAPREELLDRGGRPTQTKTNVRLCSLASQEPVRHGLHR